uniref:Uncharacterized protein n=1 Tax=Tetraselmis sp. GSL018 TaxID=582737 RepID=A0A061QJE3_9CHLO
MEEGFVYEHGTGDIGEEDLQVSFFRQRRTELETKLSQECVNSDAADGHSGSKPGAWTGKEEAPMSATLQAENNILLGEIAAMRRQLASYRIAKERAEMASDRRVSPSTHRPRYVAGGVLSDVAQSMLWRNGLFRNGHGL